MYVDISSHSPELTRQAAAILADDKVPLFIHQPNYSMLNRTIEHGLLDTLAELSTGCIAFSPLAQGMLTNKYLNGVPQGARRRPRSASFRRAQQRELGENSCAERDC